MSWPAAVGLHLGLTAAVLSLMFSAATGCASSPVRAPRQRAVQVIVHWVEQGGLTDDQSLCRGVPDYLDRLRPRLSTVLPGSCEMQPNHGLMTWLVLENDPIRHEAACVEHEVIGGTEACRKALEKALAQVRLEELPMSVHECRVSVTFAWRE